MFTCNLQTFTKPCLTVKLRKPYCFGSVRTHRGRVRRLNTCGWYSTEITVYNKCSWKGFFFASHKLLTLSFFNFGHFLLPELVDLDQVCEPSCSHWPFQCTWRWNSHSSSLLLSQLAAHSEVCFVSLSTGKTYQLTSFNFLTNVLRCCYIILCLIIYFFKIPSILWSSLVSPAVQNI